MRRVFEITDPKGAILRVSDVSMDPTWAPIKAVAVRLVDGKVTSATNHREAGYEQVRDALRMALQKPGTETEEAND